MRNNGVPQLESLLPTWWLRSSYLQARTLYRRHKARVVLHAHDIPQCMRFDESLFHGSPLPVLPRKQVMIGPRSILEAWFSPFHDLPTSIPIFRIVFTIFVIYYTSFGYHFLRNLYNSRKTGLKPLIDIYTTHQLTTCRISISLYTLGSKFILLGYCCCSSKPLLKRYAPTWVYDRLSLTIYGWEYLERLRPYRRLEKNGQPADTIQFVTCGRFELWTRDREIAHEILRRPDDFRVFEFIRLFMDKFGKNVLSVDNPLWQRHRKVVASVINERISKSVFNESLKQTDGMLQELLGDSTRASESTITTKAFDNLKKITIHVLSGAGMGASPNWKNDEAEKPKPGFEMTYIDAVKVIIDAVAGPLLLPQWLLSHWPMALPGAKYLHRLGTGMREFPIHTKEMLNAERARINEFQGQRANIMSQLIAASEQAEEENMSANIKNHALSEEEMMGNLFIFTAAGFDTTANTLSYGLVLLARYPQWQDWLMEEIHSIVPASTNFDSWNYADIFPRATRTMAFMLETLRLYPPLIHIVKTTQVAQRITVSHGTYWILANSTVYVNNVALHEQPEVWRDLNLPKKSDSTPNSDPSPFKEQDGDGDETRFRPTRWIVPASTALYQPPRGAYLPWSTGPRVCPGQKMAQVEFTTIFLRLLSACRIEAEPLVIEADGGKRVETRGEINGRLDAHIRDSMSLLTLQMNGIYNVDEVKENGLKLRLVRYPRTS